MDLRRLIAILRPWIPVIVVVALLAGATAFVVSSLQQKVYEAKTTLIVGQSLSATNPDYTQLLVAQGLSETYATVAKTGPILEGVIKKLGLTDSPGELSDRVRANVPTGTPFLIVSAKDTDPGRAAAIANEVGNQLIAGSPAVRGIDPKFQASIDQNLADTRDEIVATQTQVTALDALPDRTAAQSAQLQALQGRLATLRSTYATLLTFSSNSASNVLTIVEPADAPASPIAPTPLLNAIIAAALGLLAVVVIAFLADQLDDSIKDADAVQEVTSLSSLGAIGRIQSARGRSPIYMMTTLLYPRSAAAEAYRKLRVNIDFAPVDEPIRTLLVTSAGPAEGKTTTAANLAVVFAQSGRRVLLVDGDLRRPGVHEMFNLSNTLGLTTLLRGESADPELVAQPTEQGNLRVITSGPVPPNPAEQLGSQRMRAIVARLRDSADLVIFDSAPLQAVADSAIMSAFLDATLLVVDTGRSRRRQVKLATVTLARGGANVIGLVLNRVAAREASPYAGYYGEADVGATRNPKASAASPENASRS